VSTTAEITIAIPVPTVNKMIIGSSKPFPKSPSIVAIKFVAVVELSIKTGTKLHIKSPSFFHSAPLFTGRFLLFTLSCFPHRLMRGHAFQYLRMLFSVSTVLSGFRKYRDTVQDYNRALHNRKQLNFVKPDFLPTRFRLTQAVYSLR
jgi:hypothetical protein